MYKQAASGRSLLLILTHGWPGSSLDYLDMKSARRLPAAEIEARVIDAVGSFLEDSANIAGYFSGLSIPGARMLTSAAAHRATALREGAEQEKAQLIGRIVSSVVVQSDALEIQISKGTLGAELQWSHAPIVYPEAFGGVVHPDVQALRWRLNQTRPLLRDARRIDAQET